MRTFISDLSQKEFPIIDKIQGKMIRNSILNLIQIEYPDFTEDNFLSKSELNFFREKYISNYLSKEIGELNKLEKTVLNSLTDIAIMFKNCLLINFNNSSLKLIIFIIV